MYQRYLLKKQKNELMIREHDIDSKILDLHKKEESFAKNKKGQDNDKKFEFQISDISDTIKSLDDLSSYLNDLSDKFRHTCSEASKHSQNFHKANKRLYAICDVLNYPDTNTSCIPSVSSLRKIIFDLYEERMSESYSIKFAIRAIKKLKDIETLFRSYENDSKNDIDSRVDSEDSEDPVDPEDSEEVDENIQNDTIKEGYKSEQNILTTTLNGLITKKILKV
jgi:hypothetical protein